MERRERGRGPGRRRPPHLLPAGARAEVDQEPRAPGPERERGARDLAEGAATAGGRGGRTVGRGGRLQCRAIRAARGVLGRHAGPRGQRVLRAVMAPAAYAVTVTGTRCTSLFEYPPRFQGGDSGCSFPAASAARQQSSYSPGSEASHSNVHEFHAKGDGEPPSSAARQPWPPSVLTSTLATGAHPDQARPEIRWVPTSRIRRRDRKSGKPGGTISARGWIRVTGRPSSSSVCRYRYPWACWYPVNGSDRTVMPRSHFTLAIPYQPGTRRRRGNPCWG